MEHGLSAVWQTSARDLIPNSTELRVFDVWGVGDRGGSGSDGRALAVDGAPLDRMARAGGAVGPGFVVACACLGRFRHS
jgi:hypothetical protein